MQQGPAAAVVETDALNSAAANSQHAAALFAAADGGCVLLDRTSWGVLEVSGDDRLRFLHGQTTNKFDGVPASTVVPTAVVTNTGRVVDLCDAVLAPAADHARPWQPPATVMPAVAPVVTSAAAVIAVGAAKAAGAAGTAERVMLVCSPERRHTLLNLFRRFIFPLDRVAVTAVTPPPAVFTVVGPAAAAALSAVGFEAPAMGKATRWDVDGHEVVIYDGTSLRLPGATVITAAGAAAAVRAALTAATKAASTSASSASATGGDEAWDMLRIRQGRPAVGRELTDEYNALEAGLFHAVHFDKGCYIGQETIGRLNAYDGVRLGLFGVQLAPGIRSGAAGAEGSAAAVAVGTKLLAAKTGERAGVITSVMPSGASGTGAVWVLAYIRRKIGGVGLQVTADGTELTGTVENVPYPTRSDAESAAPPKKAMQSILTNAAAAAAAGPSALELVAQEAQRAAEKARKAAKLAATAAKLEALQARRRGADTGPGTGSGVGE